MFQLTDMWDWGSGLEIREFHELPNMSQSTNCELVWVHMEGGPISFSTQWGGYSTSDSNMLLSYCCGILDQSVIDEAQVGVETMF